MKITMLTLLALVQVPNAVLGKDFPGPPLTRELKATMTAADDAFQAERYREAHRIYENDLVPMGDKYSQYLIGWMNVQGLGVHKDLVLGVAWLELAAERNHAKLSEVRDEVAVWLSTEEKQKVPAQLEELRVQYGDCAVVKRLLAQDRELEPTVGTRLSGSSQPVTVIHGDLPGVKNVNNIRQRIRKREQYLREHCQ